MSNMSKKKMIAMMALVIVIAIIGTGTLAYFTTRVVTHNVITSGGVGITLVETMLSSDGKTEIEYKDPTGVMPGEPVSKIVRVHNDDADAYVRVKVDISVEKGSAAVPVGNAISIDYNSDAWTYADGWYYYNDILPGGQTTPALFEEVELSGDNMGNEYQNAKIYVNVYAQAVQAQNNAPTVEKDVTTVQGWPKN